MSLNNDLISRSAAIKAVTGWDSECTDEALEYVLSELPAVDVEPVRHGRWKVGNSEFGWAEDIDCSECGSMYNFIKKPNYCPNCGAKMDAEVEG